MDLGHDHTLRFTSWSPDRELNPQYEGIEDVEKFGAIVEHLRPDGTPCTGGIITLDSETARQLNVEPRWTVESWEPLTISPSLLCRACGDHGFIRDDKWVA